ncbi:hypothetical protein FHX11_002211 [Rhizobium sp. BK602]|nr:hypothetical protein [Rhizobium sp. BK602]
MAAGKGDGESRALIDVQHKHRGGFRAVTNSRLHKKARS